MNNREKATLIWLGVVLAGALYKREMRGPIWGVVKAFFAPKLIGPLLVFAGWTVGLVALADVAGLWRSDIRNEAITWFVTVGIVLFFSLEKVTEEGFFRGTIRRTVAVTVLVEGFVNLEVFALPVELVLLPVLTLLTAVAAFSEGKKEYAPARRLVNGALTSIGVFVLVDVVARLADDFDAEQTFLALVLPIWLTIGSLPLVYIFGLWAEYEQAFLRINFRADDRATRRRAKLALLLAVNVQASELAGFAGHWISDLVTADSFDDARGITQRWRTTWREERRETRMSDARAFMRAWLTEDDAALSELHADTLRRRWRELDAVQRATLKSEGIHLAPRDRMDLVRALSD